MISVRREVVDRVLDAASPAGRPRCRSAGPRARARASSSASSTPSVTSSVFAPGNFSTTSSRPSPSLTTASPISGWWSILTSATSARRSLPPVPSTGTLPSCVGVGDLLEHVADLQALLRRLDEAAGARRRGLQEAERRDRPARCPAVSTTWLSVTFLSRSRSGSTCTWSCWSRMPQIATFATPGTPISRGRTVQRAITDCSIGESSFEDSPIISTRLDEDSGGSSVGGFETFGSGVRLGQALLDELAAAVDVGPGLEDEHDRRQAGKRLRADHVDALDAVQQVRLERDGDQLLDLLRRQPERLGLDLDVRAGVNSGSTSTGASRSCTMPTTMTPTAMPTTRSRNRRLDRTIARIIDGNPPSRSDTRLGRLRRAAGALCAWASWAWPSPRPSWSGRRCRSRGTRSEKTGDVAPRSARQPVPTTRHRLAEPAHRSIRRSNERHEARCRDACHARARRHSRDSSRTLFPPAGAVWANPRRRPMGG